MNLRKINASERTRMYSKFGFVVFIILMCCFYIPLVATTVQSSHYKIPLENRTCDEIYNLSIHNKLFSDNHSKTYNSESVMLYYMRNCQ